VKAVVVTRQLITEESENHAGKKMCLKKGIIVKAVVVTRQPITEESENHAGKK
jgi:hypothetical protein